MEATKIYLKRQENNDWKLTKKNVKFIYDINGSMLAEECEALIRGEDINKSNTAFI